MKTVMTLCALTLTLASGISSRALANPITPYNHSPICKNGFVPAQLPDGTWRCLPRYH